MLDASRIQIRQNTESQNIGSSGPSRRLSDKDDSSSNASFLFSHLVKKKSDSSVSEHQLDADENPIEPSFTISDLVSPRKQGLSDECYTVASESHAKAIPVFSPTFDCSGEADLFADDDEEVTIRLPAQDECYPDLRRPLRRLFEDDPDEDKSETPKLISPKKKIRQKKDKKHLLKTPVKNQPLVMTEKTPSKLPVLEAGHFSIQTPVKSPVIRTPVKTPAQKRGDQNIDVIGFGAELRTPVKTPVKTPAQKRGDQNVVLSSNDRTPVKSASPNTPVVDAPVKSSGSRKRKNKPDSEIKTAATPEKRKTVSKPETASTPLATTPATIERPSRRKSVSIRFGIDDVPLTDAIWSPGGKSSRDFKNNSPLKSWTPKSKLFASPLSKDLTPTSRSKICKTPKSLFAPDPDSAISESVKKLKSKPLSVSDDFSEVSETNQTHSRKRKKRNEESRTSKTEDETDPWIVLDPTISESDPKSSQEISDQSSARRKSKRVNTGEEEVRPTLTVISFAKTLTNSDLNSSPPTVDLNDSLGQKIQEISLKNPQKDLETFSTPTVKKVKITSSPKTRTPKRLRSGSKKLSPSSKRKRLQISFANSPPVIVDTRKRKLTETQTNESEETFSDPRSPPPSLSANVASLTPMKSPGKYWAVVEREESPAGIKMRLNRKKKPEQKSNFVSRISRRMTNDIGLPPEVLRQLVTF